MKRIVLAIGLMAAVWPGCESSPPAEKGGDVVVLLHGLGRSDLSMRRMQLKMEARGYEVVNVAYPSTEYSIEYLANEVLCPELDRCCSDRDRRVDFVTHSMGGIVLRYYLAHDTLANLGRVVMLSPPNRGSEVAEWAAKNEVIREIFGPALAELGTDTSSVPNRLGPVDFELGVITGDRSLNPLFSRMIPGADDGKVSVERAKVSGMTDFLVVPHTHTYIMLSEDVIEQTIYFLEHGKFRRDSAGSDR